MHNHTDHVTVLLHICTLDVARGMLGQYLPGARHYFQVEYTLNTLESELTNATDFKEHNEIVLKVVFPDANLSTVNRVTLDERHTTVGQFLL